MEGGERRKINFGPWRMKNMDDPLPHPPSVLRGASVAKQDVWVGQAVEEWPVERAPAARGHDGKDAREQRDPGGLQMRVPPPLSGL
mmetsp:Transcript_19118/g.55591  ORF Transcript_19118/g.55591 Transcript_19118/m.55591 type:complete len:86 (+) Transcript_19118:2452-2709(+)